jgi:hypothetical protein
MEGLNPLKSKVFNVTVIELTAIKSPASSGLMISEVDGYNKPAARGIARVL